MSLTLLRVWPDGDNKNRFGLSRARGILRRKKGESMALTDLTKSLNDAVSSYNDSLTEAVKSPGFSITMGGKVLTQLDDRIMSLSLTDNRGFDADQLSISIDDSDGMVALPPRGLNLPYHLAGWVNR